MKIEEPTDREAWLAARRKGIGASEAAAICGASRWSSPYSVWLEKIDGKSNFGQENEMMQAGHRHERTIAEWFAEQHPDATIKDLGDFAMVWADLPVPMFATLDRLITDMGVPSAVLELKCAWGPSGKQWETQVPLAYQIQMTHQMLCAGLQTAYVAALIDGYKFRWHRMDFNQKFADALVRKLAKFWKFVETREPPPVDFSKATTDALAAQWMPPNPTTVELPMVALDWTNERAAIAGRIKSDEQRDSLLANLLRQAIGENEVGVLPDGDTGWSWKSNGKSRTLRKCKVKHGIGAS